MKTKRTKHMLIAAAILTALSVILSFGPLVIYGARALMNSNATTADKCILLSMICVGTILSIVCILNKYTPRCRIWLVLIGLYVCLDNLIGCIIVLAVTQFLDEMIVHPMARSYRNKYTINKEMDKRA